MALRTWHRLPFSRFPSAGFASEIDRMFDRHVGEMNRMWRDIFETSPAALDRMDVDSDPFFSDIAPPRLEWPRYYYEAPRRRVTQRAADETSQENAAAKGAQEEQTEGQHEEGGRQQDQATQPQQQAQAPAPPKFSRYVYHSSMVREGDSAPVRHELKRYEDSTGRVKMWKSRAIGDEELVEQTNKFGEEGEEQKTLTEWSHEDIEAFEKKWAETPFGSNKGDSGKRAIQHGHKKQAAGEQKHIEAEKHKSPEDEPQHSSQQQHARAAM